MQTPSSQQASAGSGASFHDAAAISLITALTGANVVCVDPPWRYGRDAKSNGWTGSATKHYPTMRASELAAMGVGEHTAKDCVLLMWATSSKLGEAISLIGEWGFDYKGVFLTWIKTDKEVTKPILGLGLYTRSSTEFLLFGTKGHVKTAGLLTGATSASGLLFHPRGQHSAKPFETYDRITEVFGGAGVRKRVELFAREQNPPPKGWCVWGNQCGGGKSE
jgi:N6-adenosine-specific RNA methylase IME4